MYIVDDHAVVRRGLRGYLELVDDMEVVGEAADGQEALDRSRRWSQPGSRPMWS